MKVKVVIHEAEEGGYWAEVPAIPGCATQGETFEELLRNPLRSCRGMPLLRYAIVIERARSNYSAFVPDLSGCVATGATVKEIERNLREAIRLHLKGLQEDGLTIPKPTSICEYIEP